MIGTNHLNKSFGCLQIAVFNSGHQLVHIVIILTEYGGIKHMLPVDVFVVQLCLHSVLKRGCTQIGAVAKFLHKRITNGKLRFNQQLVTGTNTRATGFPDDKIITVLAAVEEAVSVL